MMKIRRTLTVFVATMLVFSTATVVFADTDYNAWNTQAAYPSDVINTELFAPVKTLIDKKIITGYPDGTFKPQNLITRAEMAVGITKLTNKTANVESKSKVNKFTDLNTSNYDWARGYVNVLSDDGIIKGLNSTTYGPDKNISYAELITLLIRTKNGAASEVESYGTWPTNYIEYAQRYNLLGTVTVKDWSAPATRGDMAKLMYRIMPKSTT